MSKDAYVLMYRLRNVQHDYTAQLTKEPVLIRKEEEIVDSAPDGSNDHEEESFFDAESEESEELSDQSNQVNPEDDEEDEASHENDLNALRYSFPRHSEESQPNYTDLNEVD